ncbi:hypothetical protein [Oceanidesulfovibrio indonesiensis]|nr:hypothetical protein [Oceanidesulfovibrio indonesiensis]
MTILEELHPTPQALASDRVARISMHSRNPQDFELLLQSGFCVVCSSGCSVREFLCIQMGVCGDYTQIRIQTIFLNGKPVDDLDTAIVHPGDHLAFSAAMPGLVGATMRRGGYYARMRESISLRAPDDTETETGPDCFVRVRLFNFLARELAHVFLRKGLYVGGERFLEFLDHQAPSFFERLGNVRCNDEPVPAMALPDHLAAFRTMEAVNIQDNEELS